MNSCRLVKMRLLHTVVRWPSLGDAWLILGAGARYNPNLNKEPTSGHPSCIRTDERWSIALPELSIIQQMPETDSEREMRGWKVSPRGLSQLASSASRLITSAMVSQCPSTSSTFI